MAQRLLEARYAYHWNPLAGSLVGQLRALEVEAESSVVATVTGLAVQPPFSLPALRGACPQPSNVSATPDEPPSVAPRHLPPRSGGRGDRSSGHPRPSPGQAPSQSGGREERPAFALHPQSILIPAQLHNGLNALGLRVSLIYRDSHQQSRIEPVRRRLIRRRIRRELARERPVTAFRAGLDTAGPTWGLIIGFDDERAAWYRDGPLTEQVGPWLPDADFDYAPDLCAILAQVRRAPDPDAMLESATHAQSDAAPLVVNALRDWIAVFEADTEIDPQGHAQAAQTLAAGWGEAAEFWRGYPDSAEAAVAQAVALTLSRYATLFPYPMGGVPNNPGMRRAATAILRETIGVLE